MKRVFVSLPFLAVGAIIVIAFAGGFNRDHTVPGEEARKQSADFLATKLASIKAVAAQLESLPKSPASDEANRRLKEIDDTAQRAQKLLDEKRLHSGWYGDNPEYYWNAHMRFIDWALNYAQRTAQGEARAAQLKTSLDAAEQLVAECVDCPAKSFANLHLAAAKLDYQAAKDAGWEPDMLDLGSLSAQTAIEALNNPTAPFYTPKGKLDVSVYEERLNPVLCDLRSRIYHARLSPGQYSERDQRQVEYADLTLEVNLRKPAIIRGARGYAHSMAAALLATLKDETTSVEMSGYPGTLFKSIRELGDVRLFVEQIAPANETAWEKMAEADRLIRVVLSSFADMFSDLDNYDNSRKAARQVRVLVEEARQAAVPNKAKTIEKQEKQSNR